MGKNTRFGSVAPGEYSASHYAESMRVLVTGATGFVGGAVARQLLARGDVVRVVVRSLSRADALRRAGAEIHVGDVAEKHTLRVPMAGVDAVFHVAGWYKVGDRDTAAAIRTNVDGTRHVLELMEELAIPKGVYTSTLAVNSDTDGRIVDETYRHAGPYLSTYERTKARAHAIADGFIARGLPLVIVQPGLVYGPDDSSSVRTMLRQYLTRKLPVLPRGTAFSWGHIDDIASGHVRALDQGATGRNYFLAGPAHSFVEAIEIAEQITGISGPRWRVPVAAMRVAAACARAVEKIVALPAEYTGEGLRTLAGTTYLGSSARATRELAWTARPLREGLRETLRHEARQLFGRPPSF